MRPSIVAMLGWIMPAPVEMPVTVMVRPSITTWRETALGTVSVVMIASAAEAQLDGARSARHAGKPDSMRSTGSTSMITPVESGSTWRSSTPSNGGGRSARRARRGEALRPGAGVRHAGVHDDGADRILVGKMFKAHLDRRRGEAVAGKDTRHAAAFGQGDQQEILAVGLANARARDAESNAGDREELFRARRF